MAPAARRKLEPVEDDNNQETPETGSASGELVAATGEVVNDGDGSKLVTWRGIGLTIPPEIPPVLMFDFVSMEGDDSAMSLMRMFHTLFDTAQFTEVRNTIAKLKADEQITAIGDLAKTVMDAYGTTEGESEASEDS